MARMVSLRNLGLKPTERFLPERLKRLTRGSAGLEAVEEIGPTPTSAAHGARPTVAGRTCLVISRAKLRGRATWAAVWDDLQEVHGYFSQEAVRRLSEAEAVLVVDPGRSARPAATGSVGLYPAPTEEAP